MALREQCVAELPKADPTCFDVLESQALALGYSQGRHQMALRPAQPVQDISAKCVVKHDILSTGIELAIKRGLLAGHSLRELRGPVGYKNQAADLIALVALYRDNEKALAGRTGISKEDLDEAEALAYQLFGAIGEREQLPITVAATTEARQRAFTLFMNTYDDVRRIVHYLRWKEGDADEIAPSVYAGRKRGSKDSDLSEQPVEGETPAVAANAEQKSKAEPKPKNDVPVGMPGSDPYVSAE